MGMAGPTGEKRTMVTVSTLIERFEYFCRDVTGTLTSTGNIILHDHEPG